MESLNRPFGIASSLIQGHGWIGGKRTAAGLSSSFPTSQSRDAGHPPFVLFKPGPPARMVLTKIDQLDDRFCSIVELIDGNNCRIGKELMTYLQRLAVLSLGLSVFSTLAIGQEPAPSNPPPATTQTTTTTTVQDTPAPVPMTKRELKEQRRRQKLQEKAANADAKAHKDSAKADKNDAKALKQEDKSTDATEKSNSPK
jgi:hypothetical protein